MVTNGALYGGPMLPVKLKKIADVVYLCCNEDSRVACQLQ